VSRALSKLWLILTVAIGLAFLFLPLVMLAIHLGFAQIWQQLQTPAAFDALYLSVTTSIASLVVVVLIGMPIAYLLGTSEFYGKRLIEVLLQMLIVTPTTVAGVGLLLVFGRPGLFGHWLESVGVSISFSTPAVIFAQAFIALPFFIQAGKTAFAGVPQSLVQASRTLGASPGRTFFKVIVPLAAPGLISGLVLSWAKALAEFGVTLMFAGNLPGKTQTLPLAIYTALETDLDLAIAMSVLLLTVSFILLLSVKLVEMMPEMRRRRRRKGVMANAHMHDDQVSA
jgi:molybdate transport system permease protein